MMCKSKEGSGQRIEGQEILLDMYAAGEGEPQQTDAKQKLAI